MPCGNTSMPSLTPAAAAGTSVDGRRDGSCEFGSEGAADGAAEASALTGTDGPADGSSLFAIDGSADGASPGRLGRREGGAEGAGDGGRDGDGEGGRSASASSPSALLAAAIIRLGRLDPTGEGAAD